MKEEDNSALHQLFDSESLFLAFTVTASVVIEALTLFSLSFPLRLLSPSNMWEDPLSHTRNLTYTHFTAHTKHIHPLTHPHDHLC